MLKQRIITALILGPLVLWVVIGASHMVFASLMAVIVVIGAWEWAALAGITSNAGKIIHALAYIPLLFVIMQLMHSGQQWIHYAMYFISAWWVLSLALIVIYNSGSNFLATRNIGHLIIKLLIGVCVLAGVFIAFVGLRNTPQYGYKFVLILLILMWLADSGAYFFGRRFGKRKLAVNVSPGKSWEGVYGAVLLTSIASIGIGLYLNYSLNEQLLFLFVCLLTMMFSIIGDLTESMFKRQAGIKDSGRILPGHGGILDRIDSLTAAAPVFFISMLMAGLS